MSERRIRVAKDKVDFIKRLISNEDSTGPFRLQADVIAFAAALGANRLVRVPLPEAVGEPIRQEVFDRQGYDTLINLLAIYGTDNPTALSDSDDMADLRATVFEEYANGGLQILQEELKGSVDLLEAILLIVGAQRTSKESNLSAFDLTQFV